MRTSNLASLPVRIRPATPADAEAIAALHAASWRRNYGGALSAAYLEHEALADRQAIWAQRFTAPKANQHVLVAEDGDSVVGFVCAYVAQHAEWGSYLDNLHVHESAQGRGTGRTLLRQMARWCGEQAPGQGLHLLVNQDNLRAQDFYRSLGARNAQSAVWNAPDGSVVPTFWFVWDTTAGLLSGA